MAKHTDSLSYLQPRAGGQTVCVCVAVFACDFNLSVYNFRWHFIIIIIIVNDLLLLIHPVQCSFFVYMQMNLKPFSHRCICIKILFKHIMQTAFFTFCLIIFK